MYMETQNGHNFLEIVHVVETRIWRKNYLFLISTVFFSHVKSFENKNKEYNKASLNLNLKMAWIKYKGIAVHDNGKKIVQCAEIIIFKRCEIKNVDEKQPTHTLI